MDTFNKNHAEGYDDWYKTSAGKLIDRIEKDLILELAEPLSGEKLLDLGCGTGNYSILFAKMGLEVTAIDKSKYMLEKARMKSNEINFIQGDIYNLPFSDESFDLIVSITVFEFLNNPVKAAREAMRVLRPEGRFIIGVIGENSPWAKMYKEKSENDKTSVFKNANFYTVKKARELLAAFENEYKVGLHFGPDADFGNKETLLKKEKEGQKNNNKDGGFICVGWRK